MSKRHPLREAVLCLLQIKQLPHSHLLIFSIRTSRSMLSAKHTTYVPQSVSHSFVHPTVSYFLYNRRSTRAHSLFFVVVVVQHSISKIQDKHSMLLNDHPRSLFCADGKPGAV